jgi:hypothetical protein
MRKRGDMGLWDSMMQARTIRIGSVEARPGEKKRGTLKVAERPLSDVCLPVGIINGVEPGPTLCVIAGEHAMEYAGIDAAIRIFREYSPEKIKGALVVVPVVNSPAFETRTPYVCPVDDVNVARAGMKDGTMGHIIARVLAEEVVSKADCLLNLHGGDLPELLYPFSIVDTIGEKEIDDASATLGKVFGAKYVIQRERKPGKMREPDYRPRVGVPSIVGEAGSLGRFDESDIEVHVTGVKNAMKHLKMIEGKPIIQADQKIVYGGRRIRAGSGGLFYPTRSAGDLVSKGDVLGEIRDVWGENKEKVIAPEDGLITFMFFRHVVNTGDPLFSLGLIRE